MPSGGRLLNHNVTLVQGSVVNDSQPSAINDGIVYQPTYSRNNDEKLQHTVLVPEDKQFSNCSHSNDMQSMLLPAGEISSSHSEKLINALISVLHKHGGEV